MILMFRLSQGGFKTHGLRRAPLCEKVVQRRQLTIVVKHHSADAVHEKVSGILVLRAAKIQRTLEVVQRQARRANENRLTATTEKNEFVEHEKYLVSWLV